MPGGVGSVHFPCSFYLLVFASALWMCRLDIQKSGMTAQSIVYRIYHWDPHNLYKWSIAIRTETISCSIQSNMSSIKNHESWKFNTLQSIQSQESLCCLLPYDASMHESHHLFHLGLLKNLQQPNSPPASKSSARKRPQKTHVGLRNVGHFLVNHWHHLNNRLVLVKQGDLFAPFNFFWGLQNFLMPIDVSPKVGWLGKVSQLMTLFVEVGVEAKLGLQEPGLFAAFKRNKPWYDSINFLGDFFFVAFPSGNILNHLQNKKQVKKKHKTNPITPMRFVCLFCFVLFCFVLFCSFKVTEFTDVLPY